MLTSLLADVHVHVQLFQPCVCLCVCGSAVSYRVGHNEVIGVCRVGNDAETLGRDHWSEMLTYPRKPIAHWHPLVEVRVSVYVCACIHGVCIYLSVFVCVCVCVCVYICMCMCAYIA